MIQINLLPDLKKEYINSQKTKGMVIGVAVLITLGAVGLSILLFVYVNFIQQFQINLATSDIERKSNELQSVKDVDKYLTVQNQLSSIESLHDQKGAYSRLFNFLNVLNPSPPNNVTLNGIQLLAGDRSVVFDGTTASFESLNVFVDTLKNAQVGYKPSAEEAAIKELMFEDVLVQSSGLAKVENTTVVAFTVKGVYREAAFDARFTDVQAEVPSITTTPSATEAPVPQQLFNDTEPEAQ